VAGDRQQRLGGGPRPRRGRPPRHVPRGDEARSPRGRPPPGRGRRSAPGPRRGGGPRDRGGIVSRRPSGRVQPRRRRGPGPACSSRASSGTGPLGQGEGGRAAQRVAPASSTRWSPSGDGGPAAALDPQLVAAGEGRAQLAAPPEAHPPAGASGRRSRPTTSIAPGSVRPARTGRTRHLRRQPRRPAAGDRRERRAARARAPRPPRARGRGAARRPVSAARIARARAGRASGQRAHVERRLGVDRRPPGRREREEPQGDGEAEAAGEGDEAHQARHSTAVDALAGGGDNAALSRPARERSVPVKVMCLVAPRVPARLRGRRSRRAEARETRPGLLPRRGRTGRPTRSRTTGGSGRSCWPGSRRRSPGAERRSASRSVRAATGSGSSTSRTSRPAPTPRRRTRSSRSRSTPTTPSWPTPTRRPPGPTGSSCPRSGSPSAGPSTSARTGRSSTSTGT
jgi:hypothetical protein